MTRPIAPLSLLAAGLLLVAGCGGSGSGGSGAGSGGAGSKVLTVATSDDVKSLDTAKAFDTWSTALVHAMTRRLVDYDLQGEIVPDLAERWEVTDGGKTYTFTLRGDATFADGKPIEARNFQLAIERIQKPATASPGASFYSGITRMEATDPKTFVVHLAKPDPTLLNVMGMTFAAPIQEGQAADRPAASGPFELESYEPGAKVVLRKNPRDPRNPSTLQQLVLQLGVEEALQLSRFQNGEVDLLARVPPAERAVVATDPEQQDNLVQGVVNQTWYFGMNVTRPPWNNPKIRQAVLLALDRDRHVQLAGAGQAANGILPPHVPGYHAGRALPKRDIARAKQLVNEVYPDGPPQSVMWLVNSDLYEAHAEAIQSDLADAGLLVELRPVTYSEYLTGYKSKADCWYGGWFPDFPDAGNFLEPVLHSRSIRPGASQNAARYSNPKVDALLDQAHGTAKGPARDALYKQAEDLVLKDIPWAPLYFEMETRYFRDGVTGVTVHPVWRQMLTGIDKR